MSEIKNNHELGEHLSRQVEQGNQLYAAIEGDNMQFISIGWKDGPSNIVTIDLPYEGSGIVHVNGLRMQGVLRKAKLLRRFIECDDLYIEIGDKVVFEDEAGEKIETNELQTRIFGWRDLEQ